MATTINLDGASYDAMRIRKGNYRVLVADFGSVPLAGLDVELRFYTRNATPNVPMLAVVATVVDNVATFTLTTEATAVFDTSKNYTFTIDTISEGGEVITYAYGIVQVVASNWIAQ
jgi:hypothetical protein